MMPQISHNKGKEVFIVRWNDADEASIVLDTLVAWVHDRELFFDWFDCAAMSHALGKYLSKEIWDDLKKK